jgi:hypothetical protein
MKNITTQTTYKIVLGSLVALLLFFPQAALALNAEELNAIHTNSEWYVPNDSQFSELEEEARVGGEGPASPIQGGGNAAQNKELARGMLANYGWDTQEQFDCLDQLWEHESGWRQNADNPSSTAYGIPQALLSAHEENINANYAGYYEGTPENPTGGNPAVQIKWGLDYIQSRADYGDPCGAWTMWQRRDPHWY